MSGGLRERESSGSDSVLSTLLAYCLCAGILHLPLVSLLWILRSWISLLLLLLAAAARHLLRVCMNADGDSLLSNLIASSL